MPSHRQESFYLCVFQAAMVFGVVPVLPARFQGDLEKTIVSLYATFAALPLQPPVGFLCVLLPQACLYGPPCGTDMISRYEGFQDMLYKSEAVLTLRHHIRVFCSPQGSLCKDIAVSCFCSWCSWCQMHRELRHRKKIPTVINVQHTQTTVNMQPAPVMMMPMQMPMQMPQTAYVNQGATVSYWALWPLTGLLWLLQEMWFSSCCFFVIYQIKWLWVTSSFLKIKTTII